MILQISNSIFENNADKILSTNSGDWEPIPDQYTQQDITSIFEAALYLG